MASPRDPFSPNDDGARVGDVAGERTPVADGGPGSSGSAASPAIQSALIELGANLLVRGGLVAFPTETVYGLGADASSAAAVGRIFDVKGRPRNHPLIVHLADDRRLEDWATNISATARKLARVFWPGPLTLVLRRREGVATAAAGGHDTIALRVPAHPVARALLRRFAGGIAAPSANRFGRVSPTVAAHVKQDLGDDVDLVIDGGPCDVGVESTIVDVSGEEPRLLRAGGVSRAAIEEVLGDALAAPDASAPAAPGTLPSHYAPRAVVEIIPAGPALEARARALLQEGRRIGLLADRPLTFRSHETSGPSEALPFARLPRDVDAAARALYAGLRALDEAGCELILAEAVVETGLGEAVADRLKKAAAPRR
jgi:L-threonylcarbamoyladenylate synthase